MDTCAHRSLEPNARVVGHRLGADRLRKLQRCPEQALVELSLGRVEEIEIVGAVQRVAQVAPVAIQHGDVPGQLAPVDASAEQDVPEAGVDLRVCEARSDHRTEHLVERTRIAAILDRVAEPTEPAAAGHQVSRVRC